MHQIDTNYRRNQGYDLTSLSTAGGVILGHTANGLLE